MQREPASEASGAVVPPRRLRRLVLWALLVALLVVAQSLLVWLTIQYENTRAQEQADAAAAALAADLRQTMFRHQQNVQALMWTDGRGPPLVERAEALLRQHREIVRVERRDLTLHIGDAVDSPYQAPLFQRITRGQLDLETQLACNAAGRAAAPKFSRSYFVPVDSGLGFEVIDVCTPILQAGGLEGFVTATIALPRLLEEAANDETERRYEISFTEGDGTRLARAGSRRGTGLYTAERIVDLPGQSLQLRVDSTAGRPSLIPNLAVGLVLGLSLVLGVVVMLLVRDARRRAGAEARLAEALAFRKAMEDSLVTGLRARDLDGRITYVNPAFCQMVGFSPPELMAQKSPPYWPPELAADYARRQSVRLGGRGTPSQESRTGYETTFMRRDGERFPVLIFEAPLVDRFGVHKGWMGAIVDLSAQRRIEELSRQQQERLQATARLATVGEMASLLGHELNQPLAAIASYAAGSLNLLQDGLSQPGDAQMLQQAAQRIAEQAERAGRIIKSVHDFVRRREQPREALRADLLIEAVLPLVRLQARKSGTRIEIEMPEPPPRVECDRTMVEQVLLNLTRNGIQAMETATEPARRALLLRVEPAAGRRVGFVVRDHGGGIPPEVAARLFTPFFTTRAEGMGLGLSLCRTVIEQHGGSLDFTAADGGGTQFRFTLPVESAARAPRAAPAEGPTTAATASPP